MSRLPKVAVDVTPESRAFWEGLSRGELVTTWCDACDGHVWPPRDRCPVCMSAEVGTKTLSGEGTLYSFSIVHRGDPAFADAVPYVLAYVSLDGGPTIMANVDGVPFDRLEVGMRLRLRAAEPAGDGPVGGAVFEPVSGPVDALGEGSGV
ncbi:OB-fold domain-containing protein [Thermopolyspora sp. NPDC052614]|uniref:Zn-ribbon domain-containing OB-fold protein n=1 Tax=Thermopolyspora sp. NPDC052614 TaxID=3155682 RepID=UPI0034220A23